MSCGIAFLIYRQFVTFTVCELFGNLLHVGTLATHEVACPVTVPPPRGQTCCSNSTALTREEDNMTEQNYKLGHPSDSHVIGIDVMLCQLVLCVTTSIHTSRLM